MMENENQTRKGSLPTMGRGMFMRFFLRAPNGVADDCFVLVNTRKRHIYMGLS